jgi:hypothetical protein
MSKQYLVGLKEGALSALVDQGVLIKPSTKSMHESVLPWLIEKMSGFLEDETAIDDNVEKIVNDAYKKGIDAHAQAMQGRKKFK